MLDFLNSIINYFHQYTLVDMANVFAIVEGASTVVAAIAAIIAVVITKRIAANQNKLFEEQNKISAAQADIAKQQNRIALFEFKYVVYQRCVLLLSDWEFCCNEVLKGETNEEKYIGCIVALSLKLDKKEPVEQIINRLTTEDSNSVDLSNIVFDFYRDELFLFKKAACLFSCFQKAEAERITNAYNDFVSELRKVIASRKAEDELTFATDRFFLEIKQFREKDYLSQMEDEISALKE